MFLLKIFFKQAFLKLLENKAIPKLKFFFILFQQSFDTFLESTPKTTNLLIYQHEIFFFAITKANRLESNSLN